MAFKLVKTGKSYCAPKDTSPPEQANGELGSLPEGYRSRHSNAQATGQELEEIPKGRHPGPLASPIELPTGADAESGFRYWVLEEWRRVSIPEWRRILREAETQGDAGRAKYAEWMLEEVLEVDDA